MSKKSGFHPLKSLCTAFSLYSRIPVPQKMVCAEGMHLALCFFPFVGVVTGIVMILFEKLALTFHLGHMAFCCIGTALPLIITGGIHMDGFLDTADALSSCGPPEKKREILKDPHLGAFALIWCVVYILIDLAAFSELTEGAFPAIAGIYVISRALSGWAVVALQKADGPGMVKSLSDSSNALAVRISSAAWCAASMIFFLITAGAALMAAETAAAIICLWGCYRISKSEFGGMNGDLAGFFLQVCELLLLVILAVFH